MIKAQICVPRKDYDFELLKLEEKKEDRSSFEVKKKQKEVIIKIQSKDPIALRATLNHILKLLIIFDKTKKIK